MLTVRQQELEEYLAKNVHQDNLVFLLGKFNIVELPWLSWQWKTKD